MHPFTSRPADTSRAPSQMQDDTFTKISHNPFTMLRMRSTWILTLLALSCGSAFAQQTYTVKAGDTLTRIARQFKLTPDQLASSNPNIKNIHSLKVGQKLLLPTPTKRQSTPPPRVTRTGLAQESWVWPLKGKITSGFGYRQLVIAGSNFHGGVDISAPVGTPIQASRSGTVTYAGFDTSGFGYSVVIDHGGGWATRYSHNSQLLVQAGTFVAAGQTIALVGKTGYVTGAHLDYRIIFNNRELDPLKIFAAQ